MAWRLGWKELTNAVAHIPKRRRGGLEQAMVATIDAISCTNTYLRNQRNERGFEESPWDSMTSKELVARKDAADPTDPFYRSRHKRFEFGGRLHDWQLVRIGKPYLYAADWFMFNHHANVSYLEIDRLLSMCRFSKIDDTPDGCQVDGWEFVRGRDMYSASPNYQINFRPELAPELPLVRTDEEKRLVARAMIQVMNESPVEFVNSFNYHLLGEWDRYNDYALQQWHINNVIMEYDRKAADEAANWFKERGSYVLDVSSRMTKREFLRVVSSAWDGICKKVDDILEVDYVVAMGENRVNLDLSEWPERIDLKEFAEHNGNRLTQTLIQQLEGTMHFRYVCDDEVPLNELVAELYNSAQGYGMGALEASKDSSTMKPDDVPKLFRDSMFLGYVKGTAIKTGFSTYPVINYYKYDDYNGEGAFALAVENVRNGTLTEKLATDFERIEGEWDRMTDDTDGPTLSELKLKACT